jgi:hypothetical protein
MILKPPVVSDVVFVVVGIDEGGYTPFFHLR